MPAVLQFYDSFTRFLQNGQCQPATDQYKLMLLDDTYKPAISGHSYRSDVTGEVSGKGYTPGGQALTGSRILLDPAKHRTAFFANDVVWQGVVLNPIRFAVLYKSRGGVANVDELVAFVDFGTNQSVAGGNFAVSWDSNGLWTLGR